MSAMLELLFFTTKENVTRICAIEPILFAPLTYLNYILYYKHGCHSYTASYAAVHLQLNLSF